MSEYSQQIVQAGFQLGFGGPNDPRRRRAPYNVGYETATPAEARPTPAGVGGEQAATNTTSRPNTPQKSMSDVFWNETNIGKALGGIWSGITLPRDVYEGKVDPRSQEGQERVLDMAGTAMTGGVGGVATQAGEQVLGSTMARRMQELGETYYHGVGTKLRVPLEQMTAERTPTGLMLPPKTISPEALQGGLIVPAIGDKTMAGHTLTAVNGQRLAHDVSLEGGADFMRSQAQAADGAGWASGKGIITTIDKRATEAARESGKPVNLAFTSMAGQSGDYAHMTADTLVGMLPGSKIAAKDLAAFDEVMRKKYPEYAGTSNTDKIRQQLLSNPGMRKDFVTKMEAKPFQDAGFPDVPSARFVTTEPGLLNAETGASGRTISRLDPNGGVIVNPSVPHTTYSTQMRGEYLGGLPRVVPRELMFPDFYKRQRAAGALPQYDDYTFSRQNIVQPADQEWLDGIMRYLQGGSGG